MCDAMCDTQYSYDYTTAWSYTLLLSFSTADGEVEEYINLQERKKNFILKIMMLP